MLGNFVNVYLTSHGMDVHVSVDAANTADMTGLCRYVFSVWSPTEADENTEVESSDRDPDLDGGEQEVNENNAGQSIAFVDLLLLAHIERHRIDQSESLFELTTQPASNAPWPLHRFRAATPVNDVTCGNLTDASYAILQHLDNQTESFVTGTSREERAGRVYEADSTYNASDFDYSSAALSYRTQPHYSAADPDLAQRFFDCQALISDYSDSLFTTCLSYLPSNGTTASLLLQQCAHDAHVSIVLCLAVSRQVTFELIIYCAACYNTAKCEAINITGTCTCACSSTCTSNIVIVNRVFWVNF